MVWPSCLVSRVFSNESTCALSIKCAVLLPGLVGVLLPGLADVLLPGLADVLLPGLVDVLLPGLADVLLPGLADVLLPGLVDVLLPGLADVLLPGLADVLLPGLCGTQQDRHRSRIPRGSGARGPWRPTASVQLDCSRERCWRTAGELPQITFYARVRCIRPESFD